MKTTEYGQSRDFKTSCAEMRPRLEAALKAEGFGILTEIDVKVTMKEKLNVDLPAQWILGACNPPAAHRALGMEPDLGLLLPCNVVLRELLGGGARVAAVRAGVMMAAADNPQLAELAGEIDERLSRVLAALTE